MAGSPLPAAEPGLSRSSVLREGTLEDGRAASPTGHSMGMGEVCPGTDVNGPLWEALASPSFSQAVRRRVSISLGSKRMAGRFQPSHPSAFTPHIARPVLCEALRGMCRHPHLNTHVLGRTPGLSRSRHPQG